MEPLKQRLLQMLNRRKSENPMGAREKQALRVSFDTRLKLEFHGAKVTSDAGLLVYRQTVEKACKTVQGKENAAKRPALVADRKSHGKCPFK
jgi:hypothetical protein